MAGYQQVTHTVHVAKMLQGRHVALGSVHDVYSKVILFTERTHSREKNIMKDYKARRNF
jgi:hypothetical protein